MMTLPTFDAFSVEELIIQYKETEQLRKARIQGTDNGSTLRTRVVMSKKLYKRRKKVDFERD